MIFYPLPLPLSCLSSPTPALPFPSLKSPHNHFLSFLPSFLYLLSSNCHFILFPFACACHSHHPHKHPSSHIFVPTFAMCSVSKKGPGGLQSPALVAGLSGPVGAAAPPPPPGINGVASLAGELLFSRVNVTRVIRLIRLSVG